MGTSSEDAVRNNRELWDSVVDVHAGSQLYGLEAFLAGDNKLGETERREVGEVAGKRLLHPLCHFGLDSLSWARLGADVTGLDISPKAIGLARDIAQRCGLGASFALADIAELRVAAKGRYDVVFMSWGAIFWVPDLEKLARDIAEVLEPGGFYYLIEAHPLANALDEDWEAIQGLPTFPAPYSSGEEPVAWSWKDYADESHRAEGRQSYEWPHSAAQVVSALAAAGLRIDFLHEHDYLVWQAAPGLERGPDGNFRWPRGAGTLPLSYSLKASKV